MGNSKRALGAGQSVINVTGPKIEYITNEQWAIIKAADSEDEADNLKVKFYEQNAKPERFFLILSSGDGIKRWLYLGC